MLYYCEKINPNFKIYTTYFRLSYWSPKIWNDWYKKIWFLNIFSGFRDFWTHVSSRLPNCEDRRANGTVQWAFTLVNPNISSYWSSILCPGIFQKNYARLILVIYLVMLIYLLLKKESLDIFLNGLNKACYSSYFKKDKTRQTGRHFTIKVSRISNTQTFRIQFVPYMMQNLYKGQNLLALVNNLKVR